MNTRVQEYIASQPWWITEDALHTIVEVAAREGRSVEAIERELGRPLENTRSVHVRDGVAVIPVAGPLFRYANLFTRISGATSYQDLATDLGAALKDPSVRAVVFDIDSPGGQVNGLQDMAELIYRARDEKPTAAFISGLGASAAYELATSAERVVISPLGIAGSIGTVLMASSRAEADKAKGIQTIEFVSSQSPKKRLDPFDEDGAKRDEARAEIQNMVDNLAQVFVETVARNMDVPVQTVLSDFGRGGVLVGQHAVDAGMAHAVGTLEDVIADMQQRRPGARAAHRPAAGNPSGLPHGRSKTMPEDNTPAAEQPVIDRASMEANHPELVAEFRAEGSVAGAEQERERILGIQALHGPADVKAECVSDPAVDVGAAAVRINSAQKAGDDARGRAHLKARAEAESGLDAPKPSAAISESTDERAHAKRIVAIHHQLKGRAPVSA